MNLKLTLIIISIILLPALIFAPGLIAAWFLIIIFIISFREYSKNKSRKHLKIICILIILIFIYMTLIIQAPTKGKVINALTGEPVKDITVMERIFTGSFVLNPGGSYPSTTWYDITETNNEGIYYSPWKIHFTIPFVGYFVKTKLYVPICKETDTISSRSCENYGLRFKDWDIKFNNKFKDTFNDVSYIFEKDKIIKIYGDTDFEDEIITENKPDKRKQYRFDFMINNKDVYLIPLVKDLTECEKAIKKELINECKSANAERLAFKKSNPQLCKFIIEKDIIGEKRDILIDSYPSNKIFCIKNIALNTKNEKICYEIKTLNADESDLFECLRDVFTEQQNKNLCESIQDSKWVEDQNRDTPAWVCEED
jgi:membrane protein implicated in regulation of membrane protease activity